MSKGLWYTEYVNELLYCKLMKIHHRILLLLLAAMPLSAFADKGVALLIYSKTSREVYKCWLIEKPRVLFNNGKLRVALLSPQYSTTPSNELEFMDIASINFLEEEFPSEGGDTPTSIEESPAATLQLHFLDGNTVVAEGLADNSAVQVYAIDGRQAGADIERYDRQVTIHLDQLPLGVYIIRIGSQSFKIYKKS